MVFDIYTYGGSEAVYEAFNAVAALMGGADYIVLVKIFMVLALFWVAIEMGFHQTINWQLFIMFGLMFNIFFVPKETIVVHDVYNPAATRVVANVPFGLAGPAWLANTLGHNLTQLTETLYSQPNDLRYSQTGMAFGSRLMTSINNARFDDPLLNQNLTMYAKQCVFMNIAFHFYSVNDVYTSNDLIGLLLSTTRNSDLRGMFYDNGGTSLYLTCRQAAGQLRTDITPVVDKMTLHFGNKFFGFTGQPPAANKARLLSALPAAYGFMANITTSAQAVLTQAAMANYFENSYGDVAAMMGSAAASTAWATAVAERQQRSAYRTSGNIAAKFLPIFQSAFRVIIYSSFIVIFLALMMPVTIAGKALKTFVQMLLWIEYWPIAYAFINMIVNLYAKGATIYSQDASLGITSMAGLYGMSQVNADIGTVAGYLALSVPVIAWIMASGSAFALSSMASGLFAPASRAADQVAGEIARGNISSGNLSAGNQSIMQQQTHPHMNIGSQFNDGTFSTDYSPGGQERSHINQSDIGIAVQANEALMHTANTNLTHARSAMTTATNNVSTAQADQNAATSSLINNARTTDGQSATLTAGQTTIDANTFRDTQDIAHNFNTGKNLTDSQNAQILANASASASGGFELFGSGGKVSAEARVQGVSDSDLKDIYGRAETTSAAKAFDHAQTVQNNFGENAGEIHSSTGEKVASGGVSSAHTELSQAQQSLTKAKSELTTYQEQDAFLKSHGQSISVPFGIETEQAMTDAGINFHDRGNLGKEAKIISNKDFQEYVLQKTGVNMDLNGDGKIATMQDVMKAKEDALGIESPHAPVTPDAAGKAQDAAGLHSSDKPNVPGVTEKVQDGKAHSTQVEANVGKGRQAVGKEASAVQTNVNSQSTHLGARAFSNAGQNIKDQLPEAAGGFFKEHPGHTGSSDPNDKFTPTSKVTGSPGTLGGEKPGVTVTPVNPKDDNGKE